MPTSASVGFDNGSAADPLSHRRPTLARSSLPASIISPSRRSAVWCLRVNRQCNLNLNHRSHFQAQGAVFNVLSIDHGGSRALRCPFALPAKT
jgi:hypothetical protein